MHNLKISLSEIAVRGVALLGSELYVLRVSGKSADVAVYETRSFTLERRLSVPRMRAACDIASSQHAQCVFIADRATDVIHRVSPRLLRPQSDLGRAHRFRATTQQSPTPQIHPQGCPFSSTITAPSNKPSSTDPTHHPKRRP